MWLVYFQFLKCGYCFPHSYEGYLWELLLPCNLNDLSGRNEVISHYIMVFTCIFFILYDVDYFFSICMWGISIFSKLFIKILYSFPHWGAYFISCWVFWVADIFWILILCELVHVLFFSILVNAYSLCSLFYCCVSEFDIILCV